MKKLLFFVPLLFVLGCSNWSTNPAEQESEANATMQLTANGDAVNAIDDIEPGELPCETNFTGFVRIENPTNREVTCRLDQDRTFTMGPHGLLTVEVSEGAYEIFWRGLDGSYYQYELVGRCKTTPISYDAHEACNAKVIQ